MPRSFRATRHFYLGNWEPAGSLVPVRPRLFSISIGGRVQHNQPHRLEPKLSESPPFLLEIFERVLLVDAMGLEETV